MFTKLSAEYHNNLKKVSNGSKSTVTWEYFEKLRFLSEGSKKLCTEGYINDGFSSASDSEQSISSTNKSSRKRPHPPKSPNTFRRAADYMVAELQNMDRTKAELLLNKTLKFFVDHRYDWGTKPKIK